MRSYAGLQEAVQAHDARNERPFRCHEHNDFTASASVNINKGVWYCYTCHAKGKTDNIALDESFDLSHIMDLLEEPRPVSERMLDMYTAGPVHPYWLSRFSEQACRLFQLGYDPAAGRPCYPVRDPFGQLLGITTRNLDEGPKYRYPQHVKTHNLLFNYTPEDRRQVILVEGAMDVIACWEAGFEAFGIYGSALSDRQVQLLRAVAPDRVVLAFDNDTAGRNCERQAAESLDDFEVVALPWGEYEQWGDPADMPTSLRTQVLHSLAV